MRERVVLGAVNGATIYSLAPNYSHFSISIAKSPIKGGRRVMKGEDEPLSFSHGRSFLSLSRPDSFHVRPPNDPFCQLGRGGGGGEREREEGRISSHALPNPQANWTT